MARSSAGGVPYDYGVPEVLPSTAIPDATQRVQVRADAFGSTVAQGLQRFGAGVSDAGKFFGQVAAQDAANQWETEANKLLYGDPAVPGDRGFYGKEGRDALDAMPLVVERMRFLREQAKGGLATPDQQQRFDERTFRLNHLYNAEVGRHSDRAHKSYASAVNKADGDLALRAVASHAEDQERVDEARERLRGAYIKEAQNQHGESASLEILQAAAARADADAVGQQVKAIARRDPVRASQLLEQNRDKLLGPAYDSLKRETDALATDYQAKSAADTVLGNAYRGNYEAAGGMVRGGAVPQRIGEEAQRRGISRTLALTTASIESNFGQASDRPGSQYQGVFQMGTAERAQMGGGDVEHGVALLARRREELTTRLGREPQDWEVYLAHQQGVSGAARLLANPDRPAGEVITEAGGRPVNISANRGDPNAPARAFTDYIRNTYQRHESRLPTTPAAVEGGADQVGGGAPVVPTAGPGAPVDAAQGERKQRSLGAMFDEIDRMGLPPDAAFRAKNLVQQRYNAIEADWNRQRRLDKQRQDQAMRAREAAIWADVYSDAPKITAREIAVDPAFAGHNERRQQMIALINNPPGSALPAAQSWAQALSLLDRVRRPEGDPEKITDVGPLYQAAIDGKLNKSDLEFVKREFDNFRTPGGEVFNRRKADFIKSVAPLIDKSNPLMGKAGLDQSGKLQLYQFEWALDRKIDELRKAGKDPTALLDPASPDFMGDPKVLAPYQKTLQQSQRDRVRAVAAPAVPAAIPAPAAVVPGAPVATAPIPPPASPAVPARRPGETPGDYLRRIGAGQVPAAQPRVPVR